MKRTCRRINFKGGVTKMNENVVRSGNLLACELHVNY